MRNPSGVQMLHGRFVGLCLQPRDRLHFPSESGFCDVVATIADPSVNVGITGDIRGRGLTLDRAYSRTAALGEAFERYSLHTVDPALLRHHGADELVRLGQEFVPGEAFARFLDEQRASPSFRLARPPAADKVSPWLAGTDLVTGREVLIPADVCVFTKVGRPPITPLSQWWYPVTTNGAATAVDPFRAALSGLYELLERDAFMLVWLHRLTMPQLVLSDGDPLADDVAAVLSPSRLQHRFVDLSEIHGVPTVLAITWQLVGDRPMYGFGAAAGPDVRIAMIKALAESASCFDHLYRRLRGAELTRLEPDDVVEFGDHPAYYVEPDRQPALSFLLNSDVTRTVATTGPPRVEPRTALRLLARQLHSTGIDSYAVDVTPVEGVATGLVTYKVVSPQIVPIDAVHAHRHIGQDRVWDEPVRRGWRSTRPTSADLNPEPHPFP